jgi:hypothetical protein
MTVTTEGHVTAGLLAYWELMRLQGPEGSLAPRPVFTTHSETCRLVCCA